MDGFGSRRVFPSRLGERSGSARETSRRVHVPGSRRPGILGATPRRSSRGRRSLAFSTGRHCDFAPFALSRSISGNKKSDREFIAASGIRASGRTPARGYGLVGYSVFRSSASAITARAPPYWTRISRRSPSSWRNSLHTRASSKSPASDLRCQFAVKGRIF